MAVVKLITIPVFGAIDIRKVKDPRYMKRGSFGIYISINQLNFLSGSDFGLYWILLT